MKNPFVFQRIAPGVTEISTLWKNSPIYISLNATWAITIGDQAPLYSWQTNPLLTFLHIPSSTQQELTFSHWESWAQGGKVIKGTESVEFAKDGKSDLLYAIVTYQGLKSYFSLSPFVEEVKDALPLDSLHLEKANPLPPVRVVIEGKVAKVCHKTLVNATPYLEIFHEAPVVGAVLLNNATIFTCTNNTAKLTDLPVGVPREAELS